MFTNLKHNSVLVFLCHKAILIDLPKGSALDWIGVITLTQKF